MWGKYYPKPKGKFKENELEKAIKKKKIGYIVKAKGIM